MDNDKKTTVAAGVSAAGYGLAAATLIDPTIAMLLPPPFNFIVLGIGIAAQIAQGFFTNKPDAKPEPAAAQ